MLIHLGGSLAWYDEKKRSKIEINLTDSISLNKLIQNLLIPKNEIAFISINGSIFAGDDVLLTNSDTVMIFPPIGGGSV